MTVVRSNFPDLLDSNFYAIGFEGYNRYPEVYTQYTDLVKNNGEDNISFSQVAGVGVPGVKTEGDSISYVDPVQMYDTTLTYVTYAQGLRFTEESVEDQQHKILGEPVFKQMGIAFKQKEEILSAASLYATFTTAGADGQYVVDTDHPKNPNETGTTYSNKAATAAALSVAALEAAFINAATCKDPAGLVMRWVPKYLIVPAALEFTARKILEPVEGKETGIAENTPNIVSKYGLKLIVNPFLDASSTTAWWIAADKGDNPLAAVRRVPVTFQRDSHFDTGDLLYKGRMRFVVGYKPDWRGLYGTTGA